MEKILITKRKRQTYDGHSRPCTVQGHKKIERIGFGCVLKPTA